MAYNENFSYQPFINQLPQTKIVQYQMVNKMHGFINSPNKQTQTFLFPINQQLNLYNNQVNRNYILMRIFNLKSLKKVHYPSQAIFSSQYTSISGNETPTSLQIPVISYNTGEQLISSEKSKLKFTQLDPSSPYNKNKGKRNNKKYAKYMFDRPNNDQDLPVLQQKSNLSDKTKPIDKDEEKQFKPYVKDESQLKKLIKNVDFIKRTIEQHYLRAKIDDIKDDEQESIQVEISNF